MKKIWKQRYQVMEKLGTGGNGQVYKVWDIHLEKEWAMKILKEKGEDMEWKFLKSISHPNFPRIVDAFEEEECRIFIMDYIKGVTLEEIIEKGPLEEGKILKIAGQICDALLYLHQYTPTLLYLDLKPSNIILEENQNLKLVDLGSVAVKGKGMPVSGTYGFASPEQIKLQKSGSLLNEQSDVFSFGMVLYAMAVGNCKKMPVTSEKSRSGIYIKTGQGRKSYFLQKIMEKCTRGNPAKRYFGMREVKKELEMWEKNQKQKWNPKIWFWLKIKKPEYWILEKSIFCSEGRHSFYIAKRMLLVFVCLMLLLPLKVLGAESRKERSETWEIQEKTENGELKVTVRDRKMRKVLIKKDSAYKTDGELLFEIPWEEVDGERCEIIIECREEGKQSKLFFLECIYAN